MSQMNCDLGKHLQTSYKDFWYNNSKRKFDIKSILLKYNVKLRILNHFYTDLYVENNEHYTSIVNYKCDKKLNECKEGIKSLFAKFKYKNLNLSIKIVGAYVINNTYVFCTMPDARTITKAYKEDPVLTIYNLRNFSQLNLENCHEIINLAKKVI